MLQMWWTTVSEQVHEEQRSLKKEVPELQESHQFSQAPSKYVQ